MRKRPKTVGDVAKMIEEVIQAPAVMYTSHLDDIDHAQCPKCESISPMANLGDCSVCLACNYEVTTIPPHAA